MVISELNSNLRFNGLSVLYHIAKLLATGGELTQVLDNVLEILEIHAGMNRGMISILKADNSEVNVDVARGLSEAERRKGRYRLGEGVTGKVVASGDSILIPKLKDEPEFLDKIFKGTAEELRDTRLTQVALVVTEVAIARHLQSVGHVPTGLAEADVVVGHPFGQATAKMG